MPKWTHDLPDEPNGHSLPIRRTPARRPLVAVITSNDLIGTYTHFWKGRTMPCEAPNCEPCGHGSPYRWHAYFSAWQPDTALHFLMETTAQAAQHFVTYRAAHGTLRGCKFEATRWRQSPNGRVLIRCKPDDMNDARLPKAPDLIALLSTLWNLPKEEFDASTREPEKGTRHIFHDPALARVGSQQGNGKGEPA